MNNDEVIKIFEATRDECQQWIQNANLLLSGKNIEYVEELFSSNDTQLGLWIDTNEETVSKHPQLIKIKEHHSTCQKIYIQLYNETLKIYNPKTHEELYALLTNLEDSILILLKKLNVTQELLVDDPNLFTTIQKDEFELKVDTKEDDIKSKTSNTDNTVKIAENQEIEEIAKVTDIAEITEPVEAIATEQKGNLEFKLEENSAIFDDTETIETVETTIDSAIPVVSKAEEADEHVVSNNNIENSLEIMVESQELEDFSLASKIKESNDIPSDVPNQALSKIEMTHDLEQLKNELNSTVSLDEFNSFDDVDQDGSIVMMQEEIHQQLKEQDLKQIELEQKLTQQELNTLKDRKELTKGAIEQLEQYKSLKLQELETIKQQHKKSENLKSQEQTDIEQELITLDKNQKDKEKELEQMGQASLKLEQRKLETNKLTQNKITELEEQHNQIKGDLDKLEEVNSSKQQTLEELEQKVLETNQEIETIETRQQKRRDALKLIGNQTKEFNEEIKQEELRQDKLNNNKQEVEELRTKDVTALEEKQQKLQSDLKKVSQELNDLEQHTDQAKEKKNQEISQLNEQQQLKQESLNGLSKMQQAKEKDLNQLEKQYQNINNEFSALKDNELKAVENRELADA